ncbi:MAG: hypothetical protein V3T49_01060 [Dehalococcoidia bacterium]
MVTSANPTDHVNSVSFSLAEDLNGRAQPVEVGFGGYRYPGEVIVAAKWRPEYGEKLSGVSMFRMILLQSSNGPSSTEIADRRICVAIQAAQKPGGRRIRESGATYKLDKLGGSAVDSRWSAEADIRALRAVQENFVSASDPELSRFFTELVDYESEINESLASDSRDLWKSGTMVTSRLREGSAINPAQVFLLDSPESWLEVAAAHVVDSSRIAEHEDSAAAIFEDFRRGRLNRAKEQLRLVCGLRLEEATPLEGIRALLDGSDGEISGVELAELLIHELVFPPVIATFWVVAYALGNDSEIELMLADGGRQFVSSDNVSDREYNDFMFDQIVALSANKSNEWDAVLPFLQLITPYADSTRFGGGRISDASEFELQFAAVAERVRQTTPVMLSLEVAAGAVDRPLTRNAQRLIQVLSADSWLEYVSRARVVFGSVAALRDALAQAALHWTTVEVAPEIERAIYYLDQVEFGRVDHALAIERQLLRSRFELGSLVANPLSWLSLRDEFERWRFEYRRAYLEDHALKLENNRTVLTKIERANKRVRQVGLLEGVEVIRPTEDDYDDQLSERWFEAIQSFGVCVNEGSEIRLVDEPVCPDCHGRLGQSTNHTDILDMISEIDRIFGGYRDRLTVVASDLVLKSPNPDRLQGLFRLNSAGDLSDLANVLDDKVISFLNELFGKSSENADDWTSPHS